MFDDAPDQVVRNAAFCVAPMREGLLLRQHDYAYIQYGEDAAGGIELFDLGNDPRQYTNLANDPRHRQIITQFKSRMATKLRELRDNDLPLAEKDSR